MEYQSFVSLEPWTIVIQAANLLILSLILRKFLFRPVQGILERRKIEAEDIYERANIQKTEAERLKNTYDAKIRYAKNETEAMRRHAEIEIEHMKKEAMERASGEAAHIRESAKRQTEIERSRARAALQAETLNIAAQLAGKMIRRSLQPEDQQRLIDEFMENADFDR